MSEYIKHLVLNEEIINKLVIDAIPSNLIVSEDVFIALSMIAFFHPIKLKDINLHMPYSNYTCGNLINIFLTTEISSLTVSLEVFGWWYCIGPNHPIKEVTELPLTYCKMGNTVQWPGGYTDCNCLKKRVIITKQEIFVDVLILKRELSYLAAESRYKCIVYKKLEIIEDYPSDLLT